MVKNTIPAPFIEIDAPKFIVLNDHRDYPNHKRVSVRYPIQFWIEEQDPTQWKFDDNGPEYDRYIITPELLTLLHLRWA